MKKSEKKSPPILPFCLTLLIGFLLSAGLGVFTLLTYKSFPWQLIDVFWQNLVSFIQTPERTSFFMVITNFGYYGTLFIWLLIAGVLLVRKDTSLFILSLLLSVGGYNLGYGLKLLISRPRPELGLIQETFHSFPSLHAMTATILYFTLAYMMYHFTRRFWLSYLVFIISFLLIMLISFSRIYLGVHYFSDIFGGFTFGLAWMFLVFGVEKVIFLRLKKD